LSPRLARIGAACSSVIQSPQLRDQRPPDSRVMLRTVAPHAGQWVARSGMARVQFCADAGDVRDGGLSNAL
jgi:hypothetical protein